MTSDLSLAEPVISAHNLVFGYTETPVLRGCSFKIYPGEFVAIQGPSGSGKSTLLYLLGCMNSVQSGELKIEGVDITKLNSEQTALFRNRSIGFIFQQFHLLAKANVLDNVLLPSLYPVEAPAQNSETQKRALKILESLGLSSHVHHLPQQLSGGQQQRVAIARALLNEAPLILADEPTGNLDSENSKIVMEELRKIQGQGKTVVVITHDNEIAAKADRIISIRDGKVVSPEPAVPPRKNKKAIESSPHLPVGLSFKPQLILRILPFATTNLFRHRVRSVLTMVGISIGVAAVLAMMTLGDFAKNKILSSYAELGVNTLNFSGQINWQQKAVDRFGISYFSFKWDRDLEPLKRIFPEIARISPVLRSWNSILTFGGKSIDQEAAVVGINEEAFLITGYKLMMGAKIDRYHVDFKSPVCVIGSEVRERLFPNTQALGEVVKISEEERSYSCRVIGVVAPRSSRNQWRNLNLEIYIPYTFYQAVTGTSWSAQIRSALIQLREGSPVEKTGRMIRTFFERKYGNSGRFRMDADSILLEQMSHFLNIFSGFLISVALISLGVGGVGIANMMLVSVSERYREIGLRKAVGATDKSIRAQFLLETLLLCSMAGVVGLVFGVFAYEVILWGASKLVPKLQFEWVFNGVAFLFSLISILLVGFLSGIVPALRAEKLSPIEALRSE